MHPDRIKGNWKQLKGNALQLWGKITFDQLDVAQGKSEYLSGQILESNGRYMENLRKQRAVRGRNKEPIGIMPITPEIERFNSPSLGIYTGTYKAILVKLQNEGSA